jgi:hypothetical protein
MSAEPVASPDAADQCLVHHFIRSHGRRPTETELTRLRLDLAARVPVPAPRRSSTPAGLLPALRREVARLVSRL